MSEGIHLDRFYWIVTTCLSEIAVEFQVKHDRCCGASVLMCWARLYTPCCMHYACSTSHVDRRDDRRDATERASDHHAVMRKLFTAGIFRVSAGLDKTSARTVRTYGRTAQSGR